MGKNKDQKNLSIPQKILLLDEFPEFQAADTEIAALIQGYSDAEICNYDESRIQINFAGHFSLMPRF